jgi:hypothetical protein
MGFTSISENSQWSQYNSELKPRTKEYTAMYEIANLTPENIWVA